MPTSRQRAVVSVANSMPSKGRKILKDQDSVRGKHQRATFWQLQIPGMKLYFAFACLLVGASVGAQNLVPNGSFEEYSECPMGFDQVIRATGWTRFRGSPDYFHGCDSSHFVGVPLNFGGYQGAHSGEGYCGGYCWCETAYNVREQIGEELIQPLLVGVPVNVSFCYSITSGGAQENYRFTATGLAMGFSMDPFYIDGPISLPNWSALSVDSLVYDTLSWHCIEGVFVPDSAYRYVIIGGLYDDELVLVDTLNDGGLYNCAYTYFDDVCVNYGEIGCSIQDFVHGTDGSSALTVYPMPFGGALHVRLPSVRNEHIAYTLHDASGVLAQTGVVQLEHDGGAIPIVGLSNGVYVLQLSSTHESWTPITVVHVTP